MKDDLIYRQDAVDALLAILDKPHHADYLYTDEICRTLNDLPSAQPDRAVCPFCREPTYGMYFRKYDDWSYGCHNKNCKIKPRTVWLKTLEKAEREWDDAFVDHDRRR